MLNEPWPFSLTAVEHVELVSIAQDDLRRLMPDVTRDARLWDGLVQRLKPRGHVIADPLASSVLQFTAESELIHGESVLLIDLEKCTRCDECVRGCADAHGGVPRFVREGSKFRNFSVPTACYHCTDPVCMIGCPDRRDHTAAWHARSGRSMPTPASVAATASAAVRGTTSSPSRTTVRRWAGRSSWRRSVTCASAVPKDRHACRCARRACAQRVNFKDQAQVEALFAGEE